MNKRHETFIICLITVWYFGLCVFLLLKIVSCLVQNVSARWLHILYIHNKQNVYATSRIITELFMKILSKLITQFLIVLN